MELLDLLKDEQVSLKKLQEKLKASISDAPEGHLHCSSSHGDPQYYLCADKSKKFIKRSELKLAAELAQRDYHKKVLRFTQKALRHISILIYLYNAESGKAIFDSLPSARKKIVKPIEEPIAEYVDRWLAAPYEKKAFAEGAPEIYSENGVRVRSKSEKIIMDKLFYQNVPVLYEKPLSLRNFGTVYPDFTILNVRTRKIYYWEHFGMMDKPEYCEKALRKIDTYMANGYYPGDQLLITFESSAKPLDSRSLAHIIEKYAK